MRFVETVPLVERRPDATMSYIESSQLLGFREFQEARHSLREPVEDLLGACRDLSLEHLQRCLDKVFEAAEGALTDRAETARTEDRRRALFEGLREINIKRGSFQRAFEEELMHVFDDFSAGRLGDNPADMETRVDDLGLVQEDELAQSLANTNMVWKAENHLSLDLYALSSRLTVINDGMKVNNDSNPIAPSQVCRAFQSALQELEIDLKARLVLFKLFDTHVMEGLGDLYVALNARLVDGGVLPDLKLRIRKGAYRSPVHGQPGTHPVYHEHPQDPTQHDDAFAPIGDLLANYRETPAHKGAEASLIGSYSAMELVNALSVLQTDMQTPDGSAAPPETTMISSTDDLLARIQGLGAAEKGQEVQQQHRDSIDLAAMLFEFILEDRNLPIEIKHVLARLQIPYIKLAILDRSYFVNKNHSARLLLNELAQAGMEWSQNNDPRNRLFNRIHDIVTRILRDFDDDPRIFDEMLEEFSSYLRAAQRRAKATEKRTTDATKGRERLWTARRRAAVEIMSRIERTDLPEVVSRLLIGPWANVMVLIYLREGEKSEAWQRSIRTIDTLIWSVRPKHDEDQRDRLKSTLPALHKALRTGLSMATHHEGDLTQLFRSLAICHAQALGPQRRIEIEPENPAVETGQIERDDRTLSLMKLSIQSGYSPRPSPTDGIGEGLAANDGEPAETPMETLPFSGPVEEPMEAEAVGSAEDKLDNDARAGARHQGTDLPQSPQSSQESSKEPGDQSGAAFTAHSFIEEVILQSREEAPMESAGVAEPDDAYVTQLRQVRPGAWFVLTDEHERTLRAKLSWVSPISGRFLFVDRKGLKIAEKTLPVLASELRKGEAEILEEVPLFDRAMGAILERLKGNVPRA